MKQRCQHPSHIPSSRCPLFSPVWVYLTGIQALQWLDTSASNGQHSINPTPGLVCIKGSSAAAASWRSDRKTPDRVHLLRLPEGEQLGLLLYTQLWGVRQFDMRVKENNKFTWLFFFTEGKAGARCHTNQHTHSSESAVLHWALRTHTRHFPSVLCPLSNKLVQPLCFQSRAREPH